MDQQPLDSSEEDKAFEKKIKGYDERFGIEEFPAEDTTRTYYIRRSDQSIDKWHLVGVGPERGKFEKTGPDGKPIYRYLDMDKTQAQQADFELEYMMAQRAKAVANVQPAEYGLEPASTTGVSLITHVPSFEKPKTHTTAEPQPRAVAKSKEKMPEEPYAYLREALPPLVRPEKSTAGDTDYDKYLYGEDADMPWVKPEPTLNPNSPEAKDEALRKYYDKFVTAENQQTSLEVLSQAVLANPEIRTILAKHDLLASSPTAVYAIRENADVRFEVARVLMAKLDALAADPYNDLGPRIKAGSRKNLKSDPMIDEKLPSRVYAVKMALKMLGGEFTERLEGKDDMQRNENGSVVLGQHRHAARSALLSY